MPAKIFLISYKADKSLSKLPLNIQNKIDNAFGKIKSNPIAGYKLMGELSDFYKYRVGDYRIIYQFNSEKSQVTILKVEHRQGVYK